MSSGARREDAAERAGAQVAASYAVLEAAAIAAVAEAVAAVLGGVMLPQAALRKLRRQVLALLVVQEQGDRVTLAALSAQARADAMDVLRQDLGPLAQFLPALPNRSLAGLAGILRAAALAVLREVTAVFAAILAAATGLAALAIAQRLLDEFAEAGITGLADSLGRRWDLTSYVEMAVRTAVSRLYLALQLDGLRETGNDLVYVARSSTKPPCARCLPYVHRLLSLAGRSHGLAGVPAPDGQVHMVMVVASLADARAHGLLHPNCRDSIVPFVPGMTVQPPPPYDPAAYERAQERRRLLREWRRAVRLAAAALTRQARTRARRHARYLHDLLLGRAA